MTLLYGRRPKARRIIGAIKPPFLMGSVPPSAPLFDAVEYVPQPFDAVAEPPAPVRRDTWVAVVPVEPERVFVAWQMDEPVDEGARAHARLCRAADSEVLCEMPEGSGALRASVEPSGRYYAEVGVMDASWSFEPVARSAEAATPPALPGGIKAADGLSVPADRIVSSR